MLPLAYWLFKNVLIWLIGFAAFVVGFLWILATARDLQINPVLLYAGIVLGLCAAVILGFWLHRFYRRLNE
jgi:hypothetical protein